MRVIQEFRKFIKQELIEAQQLHYPSIIDGLTPPQRKILKQLYDKPTFLEQLHNDSRFMCLVNCPYPLIEYNDIKKHHQLSDFFYDLFVKFGETINDPIQFRVPILLLIGYTDFRVSIPTFNLSDVVKKCLNPELQIFPDDKDADYLSQYDETCVVFECKVNRKSDQTIYRKLSLQAFDEETQSVVPFTFNSFWDTWLENHQTMIGCRVDWFHLLMTLRRKYNDRRKTTVLI